MSDLAGMDAYNEVLDRLLATSNRLAQLESERSQARSDAVNAQAETRSLRNTLSVFQRRAAQDDAIHEVLKEAKAFLEELNPTEFPTSVAALKARVSKAVEDTNPIPF